MEAQNLAIRVHGLHKSYQKLQVLKGVDFDVASCWTYNRNSTNAPTTSMPPAPPTASS